MSAILRSLNIFIGVPSFPSSHLHVLTPSSPTMVQDTRKRKAGYSEDIGVKTSFKRAVTRETSSGCKSSNREGLQQHADLVSHKCLTLALHPKQPRLLFFNSSRKYSFKPGNAERVATKCVLSSFQSCV